MARLPLPLTWLAAALLLPLSAAAQPANCRDDRGQDRCAAQAQAKQRAGYGVQTIEEAARSKAHVLRVFFVDGYGQDTALITALRAPGAEPRVEVSRFRRDAKEAADPVPMSAPIALATWEQLVTDARYADRSFAARPGEEAPICLHSWVVTLEIADPDGKLRRRTQDACSDGLAVSFGFALARATVAAIPACGLIADSTTRNDVTRLVACAGMHGDRAAAAEAWNWLDASPLGARTPPERGAALGYAFRQDVRFVWAGRATVQGRDAAAQLWSGERVVLFRPFALIGEDAMRVRAEGILWLNDPDGATERPWPRATMVLRREPGTDFAVERISVAAPGD
jgi:hypothetical protein